jgi:hypothetical protein
VTTFVARHFNPDQAAIRDCRQSMSAQMYAFVWAAAIPAPASSAAQQAGKPKIRMTLPEE